MRGDHKVRTPLKAFSRPRVFIIMPLYFYDKYASLGHDGYTAKDTGVYQAFMSKREKGEREGRDAIKATPGKSEVLVRDLL